MNTTQLIILHNDCMVELWSSCVHNSEHYYEFLLSKLFSVTQKFNWMKKKKKKKRSFFCLKWVPTGRLHRGSPLYTLPLKDMWVPVDDMVVYIHARDHCLPQRSRSGDLHSLWYVVIDEAMEIVILKYCFFSSFLYNVSNYNTASKKTPTGMFLRLPNVHIFHIFTFTVYDISVGMWELTYVGLTGLSLGSVPCPPGVSVSLPPSYRLVVSLLSLHGENGAKVNLLDKHMSLSHLRFCWTNQSESETVEQLKVHGESSAPSVFVGCCSVCDQNFNCHIWGSDMPTCWAVSISFILYVTIAVKVPLFLRWWV